MRSKGDNLHDTLEVTDMEVRVWKGQTCKAISEWDSLARCIKEETDLQGLFGGVRFVRQTFAETDLQDKNQVRTILLVKSERDRLVR